ncbi:MAG: hypothetical protein HYR55_00620 [Acidobacteria bacterium]|nr:hypothetical protein [Acidobacteriota bacterium]MBI3655289.1 hypothetical protein [Acidobacteriota bacterium]
MKLKGIAFTVFLGVVLAVALWCSVLAESRRPGMAGGTATLYFPHVPTGAGYSTELIITNFSDSESAVGVIQFYEINGVPASLDINGRAQSEVPLDISAYGSVTLRAQAPVSDPVRRVYAIASTDNPVNGAVIFQSGPSIAGMNAGPLIQRFLVPVQSIVSRDINTGLAFLNVDDKDTTIELVLNNEQGGEVARMEFTLEGNHQTARFLTEYFPTVDLSNFRGTVVGAGKTAVGGLAILLYGSQLASLPLSTG